MSYLNNVRLVFSGKFQADVSTVNNDVRHFDNATFEPRFQKFVDPEHQLANGAWNPTGSGAFRLIGCRIVAVHYRDGSGATHGADDPAIGLRVGGADDHTSGKLVDLDPQWQLASALWGMEVRLMNRSGENLVAGQYWPHAFRDLWFGRMLGEDRQPGRGDAFASATFQSVLTDLSWAADLKGSRALAELATAAASTGLLSIRLTTFGFADRNPTGSEFTLGTVAGVIGPQLPGDPESFILGRRFTPAGRRPTVQGCSYFSGRVDRDARALFLDLSNGLQLKFANRNSTQGPVVDAGPLNPIGRIVVGVLKDPAVSEFDLATADNFLPIGEIEYLRDGWLLDTSGIAALPLTDQQLALLQDHPLALASKDDADSGATDREFGQIAIRESHAGLFVEAEPIVHRIDAPGETSATIYAAQYGAPLANAHILVRQLGKMQLQLGPPGPNDPKAPMPATGFPEHALQIPSSIATDADGKASLRIIGGDPVSDGKPARGYIDGQIYLLDFRLPKQGDEARSVFDNIVIHVRNAFVVPDDPSWEKDIGPILTQYANLYPIMSKQLINLSDPEDVKRHARLLRLAFDQPIESANYMPVTRDLSRNKCSMILRWLDKIIAQSDPTLDRAIAARPLSAGHAETFPETIDHDGGKTEAMRNFARASGRLEA